MEHLTATYVSHACIRFDGTFGALLTDPWILNEPVYNFTTWKFPAACLPPEALAKDLQYIYISHAHEDHLHIPSLNCFPRDIKILIPEFVRFASLRAQTMERTLRSLGFYNVIKLRPWQSIHLGNHTKLTLIPACETKYWDWENSGFVLEHHDCTVLNMNDCPSDGKLYSDIRRRFGVFDLAFVQYAGVSMFPGCYRMSMSEMKEAAAKKRAGWQQQKNMLNNLDIKTLVPFAGDFSWLDDRFFHCNWANRAIPELFCEFIKTTYPKKSIQLTIMYPSDQWTTTDGLIQQHAEINWDNYLTEIQKLKEKMQPKIDAIRNWIEESDCCNLKARSYEHIEKINRWICQDYIDFNVTIEMCVEGENSDFSFYMTASTQNGFKIVWEKPQEIAQTVYLQESLWAAILEGKLLLNCIQWSAQSVQHVPFRQEIGRFWFWYETHIDLNNRNTQTLIDNVLHPHIKNPIRPQHGVFPISKESIL